MIWFLIGLLIAVCFGWLIGLLIVLLVKFIWWIISGILQLIFGNYN